MAQTRPSSRFDQIFRVGIILKGLDGILEIIGGLLLLFISADTINGLARAITQNELSKDPHDFIARSILHSAGKLTHGSVIFGVVYLLAHGLTKVVLVLALLRHRIWAYPWMIGLLLVFIIYQLYRIALEPTLGLGLLTIFDAVILYLTWREYQTAR